MTTLYLYDPHSLEYVGSREAAVVGGKEITESAFATLIEPPIPGDGYAVRWTGTDWEVLEDHRQHPDASGVKQGGTKYWLPAEGDDWRSNGRYIEELGPLPEGAVTEKPAKPFDMVRSEKLSELNNGLNVARASSSTNILSSVGFAINANDMANTNITGLINSMEVTGAPTTSFMAFDNTLHDVTLDELKAMQVELAIYGQALYAYKWQVREQIEAASSVEEINSIVIDYSHAMPIYESMVQA